MRVGLEPVADVRAGDFSVREARFVQIAARVGAGRFMGFDADDAREAWGQGAA